MRGEENTVCREMGDGSVEITVCRTIRIYIIEDWEIPEAAM